MFKHTITRRIALGAALAAFAAKYASQFPRVNLLTIKDFGGWAKAQQTHFADGGVFDQLSKR